MSNHIAAHAIKPGTVVVTYSGERTVEAVRAVVGLRHTMTALDFADGGMAIYTQTAPIKVKN